MTRQINQTALQALDRAQNAMRLHRKAEAYRWATLAANLDPEWDAPWLIMAALSEPSASIHYLKKALEINPASQRARQGMHWAIKRYREVSIAQQVELPAPQTGDTQKIRSISAETDAKILKKTPVPKPRYPLKKLLPFIVTSLILCIVFSLLFVGIPPNLTVLAQKPQAPRTGESFIKPTLTPTNTPTNTSTFTPTATFTPTPTPTSTFTPTPTNTPLPTNTPVPPLPTFTPQGNYSNLVIPPGDGRWIDVNLSTQQLFAYEGDDIVRSFLVSTGTYLHPTVTGQYKIYVKYEYTDMSGPGYYLPDVPYTMYFYQGYGIHGTYWHNNFGTPMSHGCVNMRTEDAAWLFYWASIGTLVNVHY